MLDKRFTGLTAAGAAAAIWIGATSQAVALGPAPALPRALAERAPAQVSDPLPPLATAVPEISPPPAPAAPRSPAVSAPAARAPAAGTLAARTVAPASPAPVVVGSAAGFGGPAGSGRGSAAGPAATPPSTSAATRAARQTHWLRRAVLRLEGCLGALPAREHRYLALRAGIGRTHPMSRTAAAAGVGVSRVQARTFERQALASLRQAHRAGACESGGGHSPAVGGSVPTPSLAASSPASATPATLSISPATAGHIARQAVLSADRSSGTPPAPGGGTPQPSVRRPAAAVSEPPNGTDTGLIWAAAALAALAALAGGSLVRRRSGFRHATVPAGPAQRGRRPFDGASAAVAMPVEAPAIAPAPVEAPAEPPANAVLLVGRAFDALRMGDVEAAVVLMHPDVVWPDPPDGTLHGHAAFREYWDHRLSLVTVQIEPLRFEPLDGDLLVEVNEIVSNRTTSETISEYRALRRFTFRDGLIAEMRRGYS